MVPSLNTLEGAFRHVKMHKTGGADHFRSDLCHLAAPELAKKFHPTLVKMCIQKEEPLHMKGGILIPAFKKGDPANPADHRSLLLSSHRGKQSDVRSGRRSHLTTKRLRLRRTSQFVRRLCQPCQPHPTFIC